MKITHLSNSFILIDANNTKICCDPWIGKANYGGWHSFPEFDKEKLIQNLDDVDIVYISHLHDDHLDTQFLIESKLIEKKFIIKNFTFKTLFNRLKSIGVKEIHELDPYDKFKFEGVTVSILPQITSNSDDLDEDVEYDIDTSIVVFDGVNVFFNQVDNPYSTDDYVKLRDWIEANYGKVTISALMAGAASEYPHTFLNINRKVAKDAIVGKSLTKLIEKLEVLNSKYYFPAGGTYIIPGKRHVLNSLIAQPTIAEIQECLIKHNIKTKLLSLEGGNSVIIHAEFKESVILENNLVPICTDINKSIESHKNDLYDYEVENSIVTIGEIAELFEKAKLNWSEVIEKRKIEIAQDINFVLYPDLMLNNDSNKILTNPICTYELKSNQLKSKGLLTIHIDYRSFYLCLIRKKVWNGTIGALCLFERVPNIFYPNVTFSLNYLVVNDFNK